MASWMRKGSEAGWTAVDVGAEGIYGVSVLAPPVSGGRPTVVSCGFVAGGNIDAESLAKLAKTLSVPGCSWTATLDRDAYKILVVAEPPVKADELDQSVRWAISTMIDYPVSDADVAWMKIPTQVSQPNRPPHLYVVSTRHDNVVEFTDAFKQAKLSLQAIDICETAHRNIAALVERPGEGVALLALGERGVQFTVTFQGELYLDRYVKEVMFGPGIDDETRERARERVVLQVQRSLDFVNRTLPFIDINRVVLAPMPHSPGLRNYFKESLPIPVEDLDLSTVFDFSKTAELSNPENQASFFVALGAALRFMNKTAS
jgi:MSHA biogenesis protein MshI